MKYSNAVKWALLGLALAAAGCDENETTTPVT